MEPVVLATLFASLLSTLTTGQFVGWEQAGWSFSGSEIKPGLRGNHSLKGSGSIGFLHNPIRRTNSSLEIVLITRIPKTLMAGGWCSLTLEFTNMTTQKCGPALKNRYHKDDQDVGESRGHMSVYALNVRSIKARIPTGFAPIRMLSQWIKQLLAEYDVEGNATEVTLRVSEYACDPTNFNNRPASGPSVVMGKQKPMPESTCMDNGFACSNM